MLTTAQRTQNVFLQSVKETYDKLKDNLASGVAQDYAQYQKQVGIIQGLALALELLEEASDMVSKENRSL